VPSDSRGHLPDRTPVIIGAGVATQAADDPRDGSTAFALMAQAAGRAESDSGVAGVLASLDLLAMPEGSWAHANAPGHVADLIGATRARTVLAQVGIPQQTLLNEAFAAVLAGAVGIALVVGGEAAARTVAADRAGIDLGDPTDWPRPPDDRRAPEGEIVSDLEIEAGMWSPVEEYALIDSALRHAEHRSVDQHRVDVSRLWSRFSHVAAGFEHAARRTPMAPEALSEPGPANRAVAFPYNRLHCSHINVDQAAALIVTTLGRARALGVEPERIVFPRVALESSSSIAVIRRRHLHRWQAMEVLARRAEASLGRSLASVEHVDLYSCFPAAVRVQQRELGLGADGTPTITGGMPFAGGPWNSYVLQSTAAMVDRVRSDRGSLGLVTTVSGFLHKPGLAVYSTDPGSDVVEVADLGRDADRLTATLPIASAYAGPATIAACTISTSRTGERRLVTLLDTPSSERWIGFTDAPDLVDRALSEEMVGSEVTVSGFDLDGAAG
jgi:acetyl-CoA C-acetyltransferase